MNHQIHIQLFVGVRQTYKTYINTWSKYRVVSLYWTIDIRDNHQKTALDIFNVIDYVRHDKAKTENFLIVSNAIYIYFSLQSPLVLDEADRNKVVSI